MSPLHVAFVNGAGDFSGHAAGRGNETFAMLGEKSMIRSRPVVKPLQLGRANDLQQILISSLIFRQQKQMIALAILVWLLILQPPGGDIGLNANDWLDSSFCAGTKELNRAVHGTVIGQRKRGHIEFLCPLGQSIYSA